jgi:ABC-type branched-subunit amino acid transport system substrate-binding protein
MIIIVEKLLNITRKLWLSSTTTDELLDQRRQFFVRSTHLAITAPAMLSALALVLPSQPAQAQIKRAGSVSPQITVAQIVDISPSQQDISRDFLVGSRAAWQDINARGGVRGRSVTHLAIEIDGSAQSVQSAWEQVQNNPSCIVISGCTADPLATQINALMRSKKSSLANVAPWQQNSSTETDANTFAIFSNREDQIAHALKSLSALNVSSLALVFASREERRQNLPDIQRIAQKLNLRLQELALLADIVKAGQPVSASTSAIVLFIGGTPELAQFTQTLDKQSRQHYVVALADVNLQVLQQMGGTRNTPIIATQAVPLVSAALPIVRNYRQVLMQLYDEPPVSLSLAGFIAARYTYEVIHAIDGSLNRTSVLEAFARRQSMDLGGFRVAFDAQRRTSAYVTQSMLGADGRVIG